MSDKPTNKPTISLVAKRARVAVSTVSRVLNGGYASAQVKARVAKVTKELGYAPSRTARNLKMGRAGFIGLVSETSQGAWFMQLLGGIEDALFNTDFSVLLSSLNLRGTYSASAVGAWIAERRVDGLIFARAGKRENPLVQAAVQARLPLAFIAPDVSPRVGQVFRSQNLVAGRELAEHLLELGHRRIAFVGGPRVSVDTMNRLRGVEQALKARSLALAPENVEFARDYSPEGGIEYAAKWLSRSRRNAPTAVILGNDSLALGFMRTLQQSGVHIPDDVSIVGFDGIAQATLVWPGLTTAEQKTSLMGAAASQSIMRQIANPDAKLDPVEFPMPISFGESTGPVPGASQLSAPKRRKRSVELTGE